MTTKITQNMIADGAVGLDQIETGLLNLPVLDQFTVTNEQFAVCNNLNSASYRKYLIAFDNVRPVTDGQAFLMQTSVDNGVNFNNGASDYSWCGSSASTTPAVSGIGAATATAMQISLNVGNATNESTQGHVITPVLDNTASLKLFNAESCSLTSAAVLISERMSGVRRSEVAINAVRFLFNSGNISTGTFTVYGIK